MISLKKVSRVILVTGILFSFIICHAQPIVTLEFDEAANTVWVKNIDKEILYTFTRYHNAHADWKSVFPVFTHESGGSTTIAGVYHVHETAVSFVPRFRFQEGVLYAATFFLDELTKNYNEVYLPPSPGGTLRLEFSLTRPQKEAPSVAAIYPTSDSLPENLLKFHIAFTTPMSVGELYERVMLRDSEGTKIEKAFLLLDEELWDTEMKVVTLLLDPGRIKRGLRPNMEMGLALRAGTTYTLTVEPGWKNIHGEVTTKPFTKSFTCIPSDRSKPQADQLSLVAPYVSEGPVIVNLNESFDRILLLNAIRISDSHGNPVKGEISIAHYENSILFQPEKKWNAEKYYVEINPLLEDLAGNNFNRLFDEDLQSTKDLHTLKPVLTFSAQPSLLAR